MKKDLLCLDLRFLMHDSLEKHLLQKTISTRFYKAYFQAPTLLTNIRIKISITNDNICLYMYIRTSCAKVHELP